MSRWLIAACMAALVPSAYAQDSNKLWEEYDQLIKTRQVVGSLGPDLFGDQISFSNGALSFSATDVSIPGNNGLDVGITRSFPVVNRRWRLNEMPFGDWDIELPRVEGLYASQTGWVVASPTSPLQRCSVTTASEALPPNIDTGQITFYALDYWQQPQLVLPGRGSAELLLTKPDVPKPATGGPYYWTTSDRTHLSCLTSVQNGTGEGFVAITPDGTKYRFDWMGSAQRAHLEKKQQGSVYWGTSYSAKLPRRMYGLYATRVEDRFGNWVEYQYSNAAGSPIRLASIQSSDGRLISATYNGSGQISQIAANGRTWNYGYTGGRLSSVTLPDNSSWSINFANFAVLAVRYYEGEPGEAYRDCLNPGDVASQPQTGTITHPSGAVGEFTVSPERFGRTNVPMHCDGGGTPSFVADDVSWLPVAYDHYALTKKRITGPGLAPAEWNYAYAAAYGFAPSSGSTTTSVTEPDGAFTRYTFGNTYRHNEGLLLNVEKGESPSAILRTVATAYELATTGLPYVAQLGTTLNPRSDSYTSEFVRPEKSSTTTQQGATFSKTVTAYDSMARAITVTRSGPGHSRTDTTEYEDEPNLWVLGSVKRSTTAGIETSRTEFGWKHLPWKSYSFGRLKHTIGYETAAADQLGTLKTVTDGNNHVTTLGAWKRGVPQSVVAADSTSQSALVDDNGWITSVTDENQFKTCYGYDAMGRIASVTYPSETTLNACDTSQVHWNQTTQVFEPVAGAEYGIPAGHWRQSVSTGNAKKFSYFDALWRPLVTQEFDAANVVGTQRFQRFTYDHNGKATFASYPGTTDALTTGTWTEYDALGRVTSTSQDSELGALVSLTTYGSGFTTTHTNPRTHATTTSYMVYDEPSYDWPKAIVHPENARTEIVRDVFGKPETLTRRSADNSVIVTRSYGYDAHQRLCRSVEPETGATLVGYDAADNLVWSASGLPAGTACEASGTSPSVAARKVSRVYGPTNLLTHLVFPDGRGNQSWGYTPDGLPQSITTHNVNGGEQVVNGYGYNRRRLLTAETLTQPGLYGWSMAYAYNRNGAQSSITYPSGLVVDYAPNALGQPTQAGSYASGVTHYPNGSIKQFTYGNGIVHSMAQNARQLPDRVTSSGLAMDFSYRYDGNGNVNQIYDHVPDMIPGSSPKYRLMEYDGLDRLTAAGSAMFGGDHWHRYTYDAIDNITSWKLAAVKDYAQYVYDASNRLMSVKNSGGATIVGIAYDVQGNLTNKNGKLYDFDFGNRLRAATNVESYRYDGHGRRVQATNPAQAAIRSMYGQDGVLRRQEDERTGKNHEYVTLSGSVIARIATIVAPSVPALSTPGYSSNGSYTVSWSATPTATSYELQISANGGSWQGAYAGAQTSHAVGGQGSGSYAYRVRACQASTCSGWSNTGTTTVELPPGSAPSLSAPGLAAGGNYLVSWTSVVAASTYRLEESFNSGAWVQVQDIAAQSRSYSSRPAGNYQHRVTACNPAGCGPYSNVGATQVIYAPAAPTLSVPPASYNGSYTVSWSAVASAVTYQLEEQVNGGGWTLVYNSVGTAHGLSGKPAAVYGYRVKACNDAGCGPLSAVGSIQVTLPPTTAPGISSPASVAVDNFTVNWNGVAAATAYELLERVNGGGWNALYNGPAGSYPLTGKANATYGYLVRGCNVAGCGPWSAETSTVVNVPPLIPAPPGNFTGERDVLDDIRPIQYTYFVSWSGSYGATYYQLQITYGQGGTSLLNMGGATSHQQTGGGNRSYLVRACNSNGCSAWAGPVSL
ncbi:RHS repeat protein [Pseudoxanthomonas sp. SL93]|uniref:RHS repeat protein n=1 Tax=Pseudoxanthomonas sp. SL93 TaxID=2995142 RepID=UPI00226E6B05|nr:RHS repeat protein [Pseudoxanthomonas sp. SL93]WAC63610.1 RHS repeat protein [Pseudoxanthomonas sp. SL93]